jgi:hypothetical protein
VSPSSDADELVLGQPLAPGTYSSQVFATPLTFTVPEGWKAFEDQVGQFGLARLANDGPCLCVWQGVAAAARSCAEEPEANVGTSAKAISGWLSTHPGLTKSKPIPVTVGGLDGFRIDTAMAPSWTKTCPFSGGNPIVMTLVGSGVHWGTDATSSQRLYLLDTPDGGNVAINVELCCGVKSSDQITATESVIETFLFDTNG